MNRNSWVPHTSNGYFRRAVVCVTPRTAAGRFERHVEVTEIVLAGVKVVRTLNHHARMVGSGPGTSPDDFGPAGVGLRALR